MAISRFRSHLDPYLLIMSLPITSSYASPMIAIKKLSNMIKLKYKPAIKIIQAKYTAIYLTFEVLVVSIVQVL